MNPSPATSSARPGAEPGHAPASIAELLAGYRTGARRPEGEQAARQVKDQIDAERVLAAARLRPVFDPGWWETAGPQDVADMWQEANSSRDPDLAAIQPTIFDHAADRIRQEVRDRSGLDPTQIMTLAAVQELEREHQPTRRPAGGR